MRIDGIRICYIMNCREHFAEKLSKVFSFFVQRGQNIQKLVENMKNRKKHTNQI